MKWWKKLIHKVEQEEQVEEEVLATKEVFEEEEVARKSHVSFHYPKNEFKFPLISDEEKGSWPSEEREVPKTSEFARGEDLLVDTKPTYIPTPRVEPVVEKTEHKKPFKPSQIPSPIYGFKSRPTTEKAEEKDLLFVSPAEKQEEYPTNEYAVTEQLTQVDANPAVAEEVEQKVHEVAEFEEAEAPVLVEEEQEEVVSEEEVVEEAEAPVLVEEEQGDVSEVDVEIVAEAAQVDSVPKEVEKPKSRVPFNVLMLNSDKRKNHEQKREQNVNPVPSLPSEKEEREVVSDEVKKHQEAMQERTVANAPVIKQETPVVSSVTPPPHEQQPMQEEKVEHYYFPSTDLLAPPLIREGDEEWLHAQSTLLDETLEHFNVRAKVVHVSQGPSVTRFEVQPEPGVKVNKITNLSDDLKLSLAARDIRMEAPIPGKQAIGIEIPNPVSRPVLISEILEDPTFIKSPSPLTSVLGLDISGKPIVMDLNKMPHGLIAGATGSGKSVCINSMLVSLLYKAKPEDVRLLLIDPKMVELAPYNHIPHLVTPVITDVKAATAALKWTVEEMERRYELFAHTGVRDIKRFNEKAIESNNYAQKLPFIVVVIDELADLMMMAPNDVEDAICRIAQKARACGIHLIIATQRPSVDVITGLIKANVPTRIAFSVSSQVDSRTIIDSSGAERLLGRGDMLFLDNGASKPVRLQGTFVSDDEIEKIVHHVRNQQDPSYLFQQEELMKRIQTVEDDDDLLMEACEFVVDQGSASTSSLQRRFRIGYNRAARLMEMMESHGVISEARGSKPREVLMDEIGLENL